MRHAILMLATLTLSMPTGLQAVPRQADAEASPVGDINPVGTSSSPDVTTSGTTGILDTGVVVVDPFGAHLVTICTSLQKKDGGDPSGLTGPIVRCEAPGHATEQWAFNGKTGFGNDPDGG